MFSQPPEATLDTETSHKSVSINPALCVRFAKAASSAYLSLRLRSLQSIASNVLRRRLRSRSGSASDDRSLREGVAAYTQLRPLVFTVRDKCLFDSLAMLDFLAAEGLHVNWLIGVKTHPFTAHSWLQSGSFVLNDHHEHVRSYRPILGV